ncbi:hypothetical protein [Pontibacillus yanchengensis]|nr:hypothetical protein [Pontibacillus yanchengensis]
MMWPRPALAPTFLREELPFTLTKENANQYKVVQERNGEMTGHANVTYTLNRVDGSWHITNMDRDRIKKENYNNVQDPENKKLDKAEVAKVLVDYEAGFKKIVHNTTQTIKAFSKFTSPLRNSTSPSISCFGQHGQVSNGDAFPRRKRKGLCRT